VLHDQPRSTESCTAWDTMLTCEQAAQKVKDAEPENKFATGVRHGKNFVTNDLDRGETLSSASVSR